MDKTNTATSHEILTLAADARHVGADDLAELCAHALAGDDGARAEVAGIIAAQRAAK